MTRKITPEKATAFTRLGVALAFCWPPKVSANRLEIISFKLLRLWSFINGVLLCRTTFHTIYTHSDDPVMMSKAACLACACSQIVIQTPLCANQYNRLQHLVLEMQTYCKQAQSYEREILQRYVDSYSTFYGGYVIWVYITALSVVIGTAVLSLPIPIEDLYPFLQEHRSYRVPMLLFVSVVGLQSAAQVCSNVFYALLLWFAAARFEILATDLQLATSIHELKVCTQKYKETFRFSKEVCYGVRHMVMLTIALSAAALAVCFLTFISHQPVTVKIQFGLLCATALLELFMCAWPADTLIHLSMNLGESAYDTLWYCQSAKFRKLVLRIMLLHRRPVTVTSGCFLHALSLEYYSAYISNAFSLITALRVMVDDNAENQNRTLVAI